MLRSFTIIILTVLLATASGRASVVEYTEYSEWQSAVGAITTIDFTGFEFGDPVLPEHYAHLGVVFQGHQLGYFYAPGGFPPDGWGVRANNNTFWAHFDEPQYAVGIHFPGYLTIQLYLDGSLIYTSSWFDDLGSIPGFAGLIADNPFDAVFMYLDTPYDPYVYIGDFYFAAIPAPGALGAFALAALLGRGRRR
jgi:hypothetical protein